MNPVSRKMLIKRLKKFGFDGPYSGGKHSFVKRKSLKLRIPNPHGSDISGDLLLEILKQAGIDKDEWINAI